MIRKTDFPALPSEGVEILVWGFELSEIPRENTIEFVSKKNLKNNLIQNLCSRTEEIEAREVKTQD